MHKIQVLIADDHALLRTLLCGLLAGMTGVEVVGEAADGNEALRLVESLKPDVVMMDIAMPGLDGLRLTAAVAKDFPKTRVLILSMHTEWVYADSAIRAGAAGYLIKDSGISEVEMAIKAVAHGESFLSPGLSKRLVTEYTRMAETKPSDEIDLTPRQIEVLILIANGHTTKSIAHRLGISVKTADTHRVQLMERLNIHDIAGLVRYAIKHKLIDGNA